MAACMKSCLRCHAELTRALWHESEPERELVVEHHEAALRQVAWGPFLSTWTLLILRSV
jgi:hypothetical protein